jgi:hypothetical protein
LGLDPDPSPSQDSSLPQLPHDGGEGMGQHPTPPPLPFPSQLDHAQALADRLIGSLTGNPSLACQAIGIRLAGRAYLRTCSDLAVGQITDPALAGTRWWSDQKTDELIGATVTDKVTLMTDAYAWVTLLPSPAQPPVIRLAVDAVTASTSRARVALLLDDNHMNRTTLARSRQDPREQGKKRVRHHVLATYGPGTVSLSLSITPVAYPDPTLNTTPLMVALIETNDMPDTNMEGLKWALQGALEITTPPWDKGCPPGDTAPPPSLQPSPGPLCDRYHPLKRPRLHWYRSDVPMTRVNADSPPPAAPADAHNRIVGMMGFPSRLKLIHPEQKANPPPSPTMKL